jgi:hypothetical protein
MLLTAMRSALSEMVDLEPGGGQPRAAAAG